ncbi:MAG: 6,7-dimethyl-8-ribityllumazine synthase [Synergistaceae bacterium]|nr:6,7-dimethyl-8-ribityllumazine synthase [Synergistaceae bacterium]
MRVFQGNMIGSGLRFAIIASRFNELITSKLIDGAKDALTRHDVRHQDIDIYWTPGAWEQPVVAKEIALGGKYDAIIALGAVIRGDTTHHEYVAGEAAKGLAYVGLDQRVPVSFGILTCDNLEQALMRSGSKAGNKGADAALAALETANLLRELRSSDREGSEA